MSGETKNQTVTATTDDLQAQESQLDVELQEVGGCSFVLLYFPTVMCVVVALAVRCCSYYKNT